MVNRINFLMPAFPNSLIIPAELSDPQRKGILAFRVFVEAAAESPAGPRMEYLYQQFRLAIRAGGLALEERPHSEQLSFPVLIAFFQRQVARCVRKRSGSWITPISCVFKKRNSSVRWIKALLLQMRLWGMHKSYQQ